MQRVLFKPHPEMAGDITSTLLLAVMLKILTLAPFAIAKILIFGTLTFLASKTALIISSILGIRSLMNTMFFQNLPIPLFKMNQTPSGTMMMMNDMNIPMPMQNKGMSNEVANAVMLMPRTVPKKVMDLRGMLPEEQSKLIDLMNAAEQKMLMSNTLTDVKEKLMISEKSDRNNALPSITNLHPIWNPQGSYR